jgi:cobalt-zinc-cadmium efflux system outer membrane protein
MAEADLIRVQLEAQRLAIAVNQARLEAERARINLFREMGKTEFPEVKFADPVEGALQMNPATDAAAAIESRPEARLARSALAVTKSNVRLQEANGKPNFDVLLGYKRTIGFNTMLGGFQMDLPFVNRNQGNIEAATADVKVAEANLAATEALIRRRELTSFFQPLLERAAGTYRIAEAAYREGGTDLLRLLDAQRVRQEAETSYARGLVELRQSLVNLNVAMGAEP